MNLLQIGGWLSDWNSFTLPRLVTFYEKRDKGFKKMYLQKTVSWLNVKWTYFCKTFADIFFKQNNERLYSLLYF